MRRSISNLWFKPDFMKLWTAQTLSLVGSQVTLLALPLTAAVLLHATPFEMGVLGAVEYIPFLVVSLFAGVWVDRSRRRPVLIWSDIGRALLLGLIPILALTGHLRMEYLYVIGILTGILTTFYSIAYQSYLPVLISREDLVDGNSKLELSRSVSEIAGPGLAGVLVQALSAPVAIALDALSFVIGAALQLTIRVHEPPPPPPPERSNIWQDIGEGLQVVLRNPYLRGIAGCSAISNLFNYLQLAVFVLYLTRELQIGAVQFGLIMSCGSVGALLGSMFAGRVVQIFGLGRTITTASLIASFGFLLLPLAAGDQLVASAILIVGQFLIGSAIAVYNINQVSLRQAITPERLLGRMNASIRFIVWGTIPLGSLLGGALGGWIGLRATLAVGAVGVFCSFLWIFFSPVRSMTLADAEASPAEPAPELHPEPMPLPEPHVTPLAAHPHPSKQSAYAADLARLLNIDEDYPAHLPATAPLPAQAPARRAPPDPTAELARLLNIDLAYKD